MEVPVAMCALVEHGRKPRNGENNLLHSAALRSTCASSMENADKTPNVQGKTHARLVYIRRNDAFTQVIAARYILRSLIYNACIHNTLQVEDLLLK
jgi:hypothetical protein